MTEAQIARLERSMSDVRESVAHLDATSAGMRLAMENVARGLDRMHDRLDAHDERVHKLETGLAQVRETVAASVGKSGRMLAATGAAGGSLAMFIAEGLRYLLTNV